MRRAILTVLTVLTVGSACGREEPVPDDLRTPLSGLYLELHDARALAWADAVVAFLTSLGADADASARTIAPAMLDGELPDGTRAASTSLAVAVGGWSAHDVDDHRVLTGLDDRSCAEADDVSAWTRTFADAGGCWPLGTCRDAASVSDVRWTAAEGSPNLTWQEEWVRLDLAEGPEVRVMRAWVAGAASHRLRVWVPDPDDASASWRLDAVWSDAGVDGAPNDTADQAAVLEQARRRAEDFLDQGRTTCDAGP